MRKKGSRHSSGGKPNASQGRSNARMCDLCNCLVHGGAAEWKIHTDGALAMCNADAAGWARLLLLPMLSCFHLAYHQWPRIDLEFSMIKVIEYGIKQQCHAYPAFCTSAALYAVYRYPAQAQPSQLQAVR